MTVVARRLGTTPGQAWTLSVGAVVAATLLLTSLPPVLDQRSAPRLALAAEAPSGGLTGLAPAPPPVAPPPPPAPAPVDTVAAPLLPPSLALPDSFPAAPPEQLGTTPEAGTPPPLDLPPPAPDPLTVRAAGYSSTDTAALAVAGVPDDGVPVGAELGQEREQAYVRLAGTGTDLRLSLSEESGANVNAGQAALRACRITAATWTAQRPGPVVPFDAEDCVPGVRQQDGGFLFGLAGFPDRTGPHGFALVVDPDAPAAAVPRTFRVVLTPVPPPTPESSP